MRTATACFTCQKRANRPEYSLVFPADYLLGSAQKCICEYDNWKNAQVYSRNTPFGDYNRSMTTAQQMTVREFRKLGTGMPGEWIAAENATSGTYTVRCGDIELCTINGRTRRKFRSLDAVRQALREEIGVTEFRVVVEK